MARRADDVVADSSQILFVTAVEHFRVSVPRPGRYEALILTPSFSVLSEISSTTDQSRRHPLFRARSPLRPLRVQCRRTSALRYWLPARESFTAGKPSSKFSVRRCMATQRVRPSPTMAADQTHEEYLGSPSRRDRSWLTSPEPSARVPHISPTSLRDSRACRWPVTSRNFASAARSSRCPRRTISRGWHWTWASRVTVTLRSCSAAPSAARRRSSGRRLAGVDDGAARGHSADAVAIAANCRSRALASPLRHVSATDADSGSGRMSSSPFSIPSNTARATVP